VQILVAVAAIQLGDSFTIALRTGVEKVSMPTAVGHGLVGPEPSGNSHNWERPRCLARALPLSRGNGRTGRRGFGEWATGLNIPTHDGRGSCQQGHLGDTSDKSL